MYEFYSTRCWFIYNLLVAWRICGKAGKHFTSCAKTPKTQSQMKPETRACLTQKKPRKLIISVNNRLLSEKTSSPWFFSLSFPLKELTSVWGSVWNSNLWIIELMAQTALKFLLQLQEVFGFWLLGAFPFGLTNSRARPQARPSFSVGKQLKAWNLWSL